MTNEETLLASYFARYEPPMAKIGKALRAKLRARLPGLFEVVYLYENQESLVISYSPNERGYEAPCSLALYPTGVKLYFAHAAQLSKSDPSKLLQGSAKTVRFVELNSVSDFDRPVIQALITAVLKLANVSPDPSAKGSVIIRAEAQKERARKAKKTTGAKAPPRKTKTKG